MSASDESGTPDLAGVKRIEVIARGVWQEGSQVLLCRQRPRDGRSAYWYLPGGHVEAGERATTALLREFAEETGLTDLRVGDCVLAEEQLFVQHGPKGDKPRHEYTFVFHVEHPGWSASEDGSGPLPVPSAEPELEFAWVQIAALVEMDIRPATTKAFLMAEGQTAAPPTAFLTAWPGSA